MVEPQPLKPESYLALLGVGSFATVKCCRDKDGVLTGIMISFAHILQLALSKSVILITTCTAIKIYRRAEVVSRSDRIFAEREVQSRLSSPYVVKLLSTMKDEEYLYFKLEAVRICLFLHY